MVIKTLADLRRWVADNSGLPGTAEIVVGGFEDSSVEITYYPGNRQIAFDAVAVGEEDELPERWEAEEPGTYGGDDYPPPLEDHPGYPHSGLMDAGEY